MQNVLITGSGRPQALGFNLVRRYLEHGDRVFACVRKSTDVFAEMLRAYPEALTVLVMDISDTPSVRAASVAVAAQVDHLDTIINNAVTTAPDCDAFVMEANPDNIAASVNVGASGAAAGHSGVLSSAEKERHGACCQHLLRSGQHRRMLSHEYDGLCRHEGGAQHDHQDGLECLEGRGEPEHPLSAPRLDAYQRRQREGSAGAL